MITSIIELSEFVVLIEESEAAELTFSTCYFDKDTVGIAFYASGEVELEVSAEDKSEILLNKKGTAISFSGDNKTKFLHKISDKEPLRSVSIFCLVENLKKLPQPERDVYENGLRSLVKIECNYQIGPATYMTPEMFTIISKIFQNNYEGTAQVLFLKSQVTELLSHFFALLTAPENTKENEEDAKRIMLAKDIITKNMDKPPSLSELSRLIGLNSNKLKKTLKKCLAFLYSNTFRKSVLQKHIHYLSKAIWLFRKLPGLWVMKALARFQTPLKKDSGCDHAKLNPYRTNYSSFQTSQPSKSILYLQDL
jgi:AraC family transcriptional activator of pyochelin receptor